jgi:hypothetical protein
MLKQAINALGLSACSKIHISRIAIIISDLERGDSVDGDWVLRGGGIETKPRCDVVNFFLIIFTLTRCYNGKRFNQILNIIE